MNSGDSYNKGGFIAFVFSMVFSLLFFVYIGLFHKGIDLKEVPEAAPSDAPQLAEGQAKAVDISKIEKPWLPSDDMVAHGNKVYQTNCAICHGATGAGNGPAGNGLVPPPRNLIEGKWKVGGTSVELYKTLTDGLPGTSMASFASIPSADRWALVQYIRSITKNKPADNTSDLEKFGATAK